MWSAASLLSASAGPSPFTSSAVEGAVAQHRGGGVHLEGTLIGATGELRPAPGERFRARFGWDGARLAGQRAGGEIAYDQDREGRSLTFGVLRAPRQDSFRALVGEIVSGTPVGAAFDNVTEGRASSPTSAPETRSSAPSRRRAP